MNRRNFLMALATVPLAAAAPWKPSARMECLQYEFWSAEPLRRRLNRSTCFPRVFLPRSYFKSTMGIIHVHDHTNPETLYALLDKK